MTLLTLLRGAVGGPQSYTDTLLLARSVNNVHSGASVAAGASTLARTLTTAHSGASVATGTVAYSRTQDATSSGVGVTSGPVSLARALAALASANGAAAEAVALDAIRSVMLADHVGGHAPVALAKELADALTAALASADTTTLIRILAAIGTGSAVSAATLELDIVDNLVVDDTERTPVYWGLLLGARNRRLLDG